MLIHLQRKGRGSPTARRTRLWPVVLALLLAGSPSPTHAQRALLERFIQHRVLPNGLEVIVVENHGVPLVTVEAVVKNGSFTQSPDFEGLAHVYEHMFFKANDAFPDPDGVMARAADLGAIFNAETHEEEVNYYLTLPADSLIPGLQLLSAALQTPRFDAAELAAEKTVVLGEYDRAEAEPFWHLDQAMAKALWGDAFSRKNTIGNRDVVAHVTPEQMREIQRRYYVPNNSAIIIAGDIMPARVFLIAERLFGGWAKADDPFTAAPIPPVPPLRHDTAVVVEQNVSNVTVMIQWQGPSVRSDPHATFVADVFSDYLNLDGSEFKRRLVDSGLWQDVIVNYYTLDHVGPITISGQTERGRMREAIPAMLRELRRVTEPGYFTTAKLEEVKAHRTTDSAFGRERTSGFAHVLGFWWSVAGLNYYMDYADEMARQQPASLVDYATKYIIGKPHVIGALLNGTDRGAIGLTTSELRRLGTW